MPQDRNFLEDYSVGDKLVSPARTITEADIINFCGITGDWHPLHTNVEYAEATPFKERIAHGMLVLSIGSALGFRLGEYQVLPRSFIAFYGMEQVRFTAPVKIGDTIHNASEVVAVEPKDDKRGVITTRNQILNQRGEPCCLYTTKILCGRSGQ